MCFHLYYLHYCISLYTWWWWSLPSGRRVSSSLTKKKVWQVVSWSTGDLHRWLDYSGRSLCTVWSHSLVLTHRWPLVQMTATSGLADEDASGGQCRGWTSCALATTSSAMPLSAPGAVVSIVRDLRHPEPLRSSPVTLGTWAHVICIKLLLTYSQLRFKAV